jgi:predicted phosphoribosyltransferase
VPESYIKSEEQKIKNRLREMYREFMGDRAPEKVAGRTVIIVDDGIATGNTILATLKMVEEQKPAETVVAAPIAGQSAVELLSPHADDIVCPIVPQYFMGISEFYEDFEQTSDDEVKNYLEAYRKGFTI